MGSGKSTAGKILAEQLDLPFLDLDTEIEKRAGMSIPQLFHQYGEGAFREDESKTLQAVLAETEKGAVIALGGGTIALPANLQIILASGWLVYLDCSLDTLVARLEQNWKNRPLLDSGESDRLRSRLESLLRSRKDAYAKAHIKINGEDQPQLVAKDIANALSALNS